MNVNSGAVFCLTDETLSTYARMMMMMMMMMMIIIIIIIIIISLLSQTNFH